MLLFKVDYADYVCNIIRGSSRVILIILYQSVVSSYWRQFDVDVTLLMI